MLKYFKLFITTGFFSFFLQACGSNASKKKPTSVGLGTSLTINDSKDNLEITQPTLKNIGEEVGEILKTEIRTLNEQEAIQFIEETNYCDVSGLKTSETKGDYRHLFSSKSYQNCQENKYLQQGNIELQYRELNEEGQYPQKVSLTIANNYLFNDTQLKKDFKIDSTIIYNENRSIKSIILTINGNLNYQNSNYHLKNIEQIVNY